MQEGKLSMVHILVGVKLYADQYPKIREEEEDVSHVLYASMVGILMLYERFSTRLDIGHAMGVLSMYM
jgi:hypothetical protein